MPARPARRCIGAAGHGHVGLAAALAAHLLGHKVDQLAGLDLGGFGLGHAGSQLHLVAVHGGQHDGGGLELVLELVHGVAQGLGVGAFELGGQHLHALDVHGLRGQLVALAGSQLALERGDFLFQRLDLLQRTADAVSARPQAP
jgi:hypothetical protein